MSFSHVTLGIADIDHALGFYRPFMKVLGWEERFASSTPPDLWAGWQVPGRDRPLFVVAAPFDGNAPAPGNGQMVAFEAPTRAVVDAAHALALALGGTDEGAPGLRPHYHADYYGGYLRDPDGNKLCVVCHTPEAPGR
jgi:catechol 2,3-dioxygenase-like lactoylglutathione lyase family enzyme